GWPRVPAGSAGLRVSRPDIITLAEDAVGMISLSVKYPPLPPPRTTQLTVRAHRQPLSIDSTV
ncbi:MAG: hypothetical protein M3170_07170, partial [Candidatus Dormibacteraeota bacterium]|nr:hypothetical protein [Candidatus Dormibacteraeota bacterium]